MQKYNWMLILDLVQSEIWIDKQTRAIFIEFVINNMNVNVFTQVKILLETPVYGGKVIEYNRCLSKHQTKISFCFLGT